MSIFINGNVITLENNTAAPGFCVRNDKFFSVGSDEEMLLLKETDEEIIDLKGRTVVPGFNDSHMHFLNYALFKDKVDLSVITSIEEMILKSREYIKNSRIAEGEWIVFRGWNHNHFKENRMPNKADLDKISTSHPIFFPRVCGHIAVANSEALRKCNITSGAMVMEDGVIDIDDEGPTGILRENALNLIYSNIPPLSKDNIKGLLKKAFKDALSCGLTTIHTEDMGTAGCLSKLMEAYRELESEGALPLRVVLQLNLPDERSIEEAVRLGIKSGQGSSMLKVGVLKLYQDGSLGGRTAAMENPYNDVASCGVTIYSQEELDNLVYKAHTAGFQIAIHAIGDKAMNMILNSYEKVKKAFPNEDLRNIIIHCQFTNKQLLERFKKLKVIPNVQPSFVMTDYPIVEKAVGKERALESYNWKSMLDLDLKLSFSSDAPIENFNPIYGLYSAVTRKDLEGNPSEGWYPSQSLSVEAALKAYTIGSAFMNFEEADKGSIEKGKFADFVILSDNIFTIDLNKIKDIKVLETYVGGKKVF